MRVAAGPALVAARSIAQMVWRVDIGSKILIFSRAFARFSTVRVAGFGKVRVNRR